MVLADKTAGIVIAVCVLAAIGGVIIAFRTATTFSYNDEVVHTHPYAGIGVGIAIASIVQAFVVVAVMRAIALFAQSKVDAAVVAFADQI